MPKKNKFTIIDRELLGFAKRLCRAVAKEFNIRYNTITVMDKNDDAFYSCWGYCLGKDIVLKFRVNNKYLAIEELVDTIVHELAHLNDKEMDDTMHHKDWELRYRKYKKWVMKHIKEEGLCLKELIQ